MTSRALAIAACCLAGVALAPEPRQSAPAPPQTTFRAGVDIVDVDVSVLDRHRLPVRGLAASDFTVHEDGKPRPIVAFSSVDLPTRVRPTAPWLDEVAPDVATNEFAREGRLVVILMDRAITIEQLPAARSIAGAAVAELRPGDLAAVVYSTLGVPQNFTADRARLLDAIHQPFVARAAGDAGNPAECYCGACSLETIERVAQAVRDVRQRRKILLVIGSNIAIVTNGPCSGLITESRRLAMRALEAGNVTVHQFDPSGMQTLAPNASQRRAPARPGLANMTRMDNLRILPDHTGGRMAAGNRADEHVSQVFRESSSYYVLGFQPAATLTDGRFHEISVRVNRPDLTLQARRGYYAPGGKRPEPRAADRNVPAALRDAVASVWPRTDFALTMSAVPFASPGLQGATVAVTLGVNTSEVASGSAPRETTSEVFLGAFDRNGRRLGFERQTVTVTPRPGSGPERTYELHSRLPLQPGRYELRASIEDARLNATSSVYGYVDVPDFSAEHVSLSGILLEAPPPGSPPPEFSAGDLVPVVATTRREFATGERVTAFLRVTQGLRRALMPGYLIAQIKDASDSRVFHQELRLLPEQFGANRSMDYLLELPIARLEPGEHLLTVEVRHGTTTVQRDLRFKVR
jgi:VWFA-related protein